MEIKYITSQDNKLLKCGFFRHDEKKPWLAFIIPFGIELHLAEAFFDYFKADFNVFTWESRSILAENSHQLSEGELTVDKHVDDLFSILKELGMDEVTAVGYCSGAGIALSAINRHPEKFNRLVLVNGEFTLLHDEKCVTQFGDDVDGILPLASGNQSTAEFIIDKMQLKEEEGVPKGIRLPFSKAHFLHRFAVNYLSYRDADFEKLAKNITVNTLMISGSKDIQSNVASSMKIKALIENSEIHIEPEGDHYDVLRPKSNTLVKIRGFLRCE